MGKKGKKSKRVTAGKNADASKIPVLLQNVTNRVFKLLDEVEAMSSDGLFKESLEKLNDCIQMLESHNDAIKRHRDTHLERVFNLFECKAIIFSNIIHTEFIRCNYRTVIDIYNSIPKREMFEDVFPWFRWVSNIYHELALVKLGALCQLSSLAPQIIQIFEAKKDLPCFEIEILTAIDVFRSAKDFDNAILLGRRLLHLKIDEVSLSLPEAIILGTRLLDEDFKNHKASLSLAITFLEQYKAGKGRLSIPHFLLFITLLKDRPECEITNESMLLAQLHYLLYPQTPQSIYYVETYLQRMFATGLDYCNTCSCAHTATQSEVQFVCSGCRTICYCSREHQRMTWMKDAVQGMRIGHKILCPLMKIYRKWRNAADNNEEKAARLREKLEEACLSFLSHGLRLKNKRFEE